MKIPCSSCNQRLEIPEELAGQTIECPACKASLAVPAMAAPTPTQVQESAPQAASSKKSKSSIPKWAIASITGIALVVVVSIMFFPDTSVKTDGESQQSPPPAEAIPAKPVPKAAKPKQPTAKAPVISIHDAARNGNVEAIKQHLAAGTDANEIEKKLTKQSKEYIPYSRRDSALDLALKSPPSSGKSEIVEILRKNGGKTTKELSNEDALSVASLKGDIESIKQLIGEGTDINAFGRMGTTPLNNALFKGNRKVVEFLLKNGANINFKDKAGYTPLHSVRLKEDAGILIQNGADLNAKAQNGQTPLHFAVAMERTEIVRLLIAKGADINNQDASSGSTPLMLAVMSGNKSIVELFLSKGAEVNLKSLKGETSLDWAMQAVEEFDSTEAKSGREIVDVIRKTVGEDGSNKDKIAIKEIADLLRKHGGKTKKELEAEGK